MSTNIRLLLVDFIRRRALALATLGSAMLITVVWWIVATGMEEASGVLSLLAASAAGMAFSIGPQVTARHLARAIWYLPVSRREIWQARWIFSICATPLCVAPALLAPAIAERTGSAVEAALLSVLYVLAYAGLGCALIALATRPIRPSTPWRQLDAAVAAIADAALPLGLAVPVYGVQFGKWRLPIRLIDMTPTFAAGVAVALAAGVASYFYTPPPVGRRVRAYAPLGGGAQSRATAVNRPPVAAVPRRTEPSLGGLPLLLAHEYAWALLLACGFTLFAVAFVAVATKAWQAPSELAGLLRTVAQISDGMPPAADSGIVAFRALVVFGVFAAALGTRLPTRLEHLRVLPLSARQINGLLVGWPAAIWLTAWFGLLVLHYALFGTAVPSWHLAALLGWIGVTAIARAVALRFSNATGSILYTGMLVAAPFLLIVQSPSASMLAILGAASLVAAAGINHLALRRGETYRQRPLMLGIMPAADTRR